MKQHRDIAERFFEKIEIMEIDLTNSLLDIKPLQWAKNKYRLRIGKYRFLFRKEDDNRIVVYFYDADSRWGIYK